MFQFPAFPQTAYWFSWVYVCITIRGFPHSDICGSKVICTLPQLIAACHVLHRLPVPRHPPYALSHLTLSECRRWVMSPVLLLKNSSFNEKSFFLVFSRFKLYCYPSKLKTSILFLSGLTFDIVYRFQFDICFALFSFQGTCGGPRLTRTADLTLIRRAL